MLNSLCGSPLPWLLKSSVCRKIITGAKNIHSSSTYAGLVVVSKPLEDFLHRLRTGAADPRVLDELEKAYQCEVDGDGVRKLLYKMKVRCKLCACVVAPRDTTPRPN